MDELDYAIISALRENGRMSYTEIAERLGRRRGTIHDRLSKLIASGNIRGFTVIPDFRKIGTGVTAFLLVSMRSEGFVNEESVESLSRRFLTMKQVVEVHNITGEFDYLLKVRAETIEVIGSEIIFRLRRDFGVGSTLTLTVFHTEREELSNAPFNLPLQRDLVKRR